MIARIRKGGPRRSTGHGVHCSAPSKRPKFGLPSGRASIVVTGGIAGADHRVMRSTFDPIIDFPTGAPPQPGVSDGAHLPTHLVIAIDALVFDPDCDCFDRDCGVSAASACNIPAKKPAGRLPVAQTCSP